MKQLTTDLFNKRYMLVCINHYNLYTHESEFFSSPQEAMEFFQAHSHKYFSHWKNPHVMEVVKKIGTLKPAKNAEYKLVSPAEPGEYTIAPLQLTYQED
jgi:hypothetical protein